jgi:hypothetical protein
MDRSVGAWLVVAGLVLLVVGALAYLGALSWVGRLPGDLQVEREHSRIYLPITTMVLASLLLSLLLYVIRRFF